ncbi:protocadherin gamma-C5-like, partial [Hippocampus comes]|uniref:protocadherin gamma-C5-like n=1 Tax=Hippocampus comes TaxID=109280 RepID=UPI00094E7DA1
MHAGRCCQLYTGEVRTKRTVYEHDDSSQRLIVEVKDDGEPVQSATVTLSILLEDGVSEPVLELRHKASEPGKKGGRITLYLIVALASVSVLSLLTLLVLGVKCVKSSTSGATCCVRRTLSDEDKKPNRNLHIQLNTDGPIKYVEVLGGDVMSQSHSFRSCMSPMSEYSDFTLVKPSSTTDFKEVISVLDASLPDSTWTFESQQTRYSIPEELKQGSVVGNLAKDLSLGLSEIFERKLRVASEAGKQYFSVDAGKGELLVVVENPLQLHRIEVEIRDINDNVPRFQTQEINLKIPESVAVGDVMSQSHSFRSCMSPMSEYSDFTLVKPSSTTDFKEVISVLDASLPDSTWTFESQQIPPAIVGYILNMKISSTFSNAQCTYLVDAQTRYSIPEELEQGSVVGNLAKDLSLGLSEIFERKLRVASEAAPTVCSLTVVGVNFPLQSAEDPDVGSNTVKTYTLSKDECFTLKVREIDNGIKTPELVLNKSLDREKKAVHNLILTALDGGNPVKSGTSKIRIKVLDVNDNVPSFEKKLYKISVEENSPNRSFVITTKATDIDDGPNSEIEYSLGIHTPPSVLALFHIDPVSGDILLKNNLDREKQASYRIDISAKDKGFPKMEGHCSVQVDVTDVNDNAPEILLTSKPSSIPEDSSIGTVVALLSVRDPDAGKNSDVKLNLPTDSPFTLKPSFSNNYALVTSGVLDRESTSEYNIEITASDAGSPPLSSKKMISVSITDVND